MARESGVSSKIDLRLGEISLVPHRDDADNPGMNADPSIGRRLFADGSVRPVVIDDAGWSVGH
jgi:hypothetical protein